MNTLDANQSLKAELLSSGLLTNFEDCPCMIWVNTLLAQRNQNIFADLKLNLEAKFSVGKDIYPAT